jgi:hypothetical protein
MSNKHNVNPLLSSQLNKDSFKNELDGVFTEKFLLNYLFELFIDTSVSVLLHDWMHRYFSIQNMKQQFQKTGSLSLIEQISDLEYRHIFQTQHLRERLNNPNQLDVNCPRVIDEDIPFVSLIYQIMIQVDENFEDHINESLEALYAINFRLFAHLEKIQTAYECMNQALYVEPVFDNYREYHTYTFYCEKVNVLTIVDKKQHIIKIPEIYSHFDLFDTPTIQCANIHDAEMDHQEYKYSSEQTSPFTCSEECSENMFHHCMKIQNHNVSVCAGCISIRRIVQNRPDIFRYEMLRVAKIYGHRPYTSSEVNMHKRIDSIIEYITKSATVE